MGVGWAAVGNPIGQLSGNTIDWQGLDELQGVYPHGQAKTGFGMAKAGMHQQKSRKRSNALINSFVNVRVVINVDEPLAALARALD